MRVTYGREEKIKEHLDSENIECFLPMCYRFVEKFGKKVQKLVPAIDNLIFIHSTKEHITAHPTNPVGRTHGC